MRTLPFFDETVLRVELDPNEYGFVYLTLYVIDGLALADHDFRNILRMTRADATAFLDALAEAEGCGEGSRGSLEHRGVAVALGPIVQLNPVAAAPGLQD